MSIWWRCMFVQGSIAVLLSAYVHDCAAQEEAMVIKEYDDSALRISVDAEIKKFIAFREANNVKYEKAKSNDDRNKISTNEFYELDKTCRKINDLALVAPRTLAARDAFLWVIENSSGLDSQTIETSRTFNSLVRYHGDDPAVSTHALDYTGFPTFERDLLFNGLYAVAKSHEAKGLARMALAEYLTGKIKAAIRVQAQPEKRTSRSRIENENGSIEVVEHRISDDSFAYNQNLRFDDTSMMQKRVNELYEEIIREYADVIYLRVKMRALESAIAMKKPEYKGKFLSESEIQQIGKLLKKEKMTLGEKVRRKMSELVAGMKAPEIDAESVDGRRFKLSDYRGKVVVLIFWGTWCGPCMAEVPHERKMAAKYKEKPVALLGVNADEDRAKALEVMKREGITWPNWYQKDALNDPIVEAYQVRGYPSVFVIDAEGIIRQINESGEAVEQCVDKLLETGTVKQK